MSLTIGELVGHNVLSCFLGVVEKSEIQPIALVMRWNDENLLARFDWNSISCPSRSHETVKQETGRARFDRGIGTTAAGEAVASPIFWAKKGCVSSNSRLP